jgi:hypothetical protein
MTYKELAELLKEHGLKKETKDSIAAKLKRGTFAAAFLLATLAARLARLARFKGQVSGRDPPVNGSGFTAPSRNLFYKESIYR